MSDEALNLNARAARLVAEIAGRAAELRVRVHTTAAGATLIDMGVQAEGGLEAGLLLSRVCLSDLATLELEPGDLAGRPCAVLTVRTDHPTAACMASQYAGWAVSAGKYSAMGSGPMRAAYGKEPLFDKIGCREKPAVAVGVLETGRLPDDEVVKFIAERAGVSPSAISLLAAPTASQAGTMQIVARSIETTLHKLLELGFDVRKVVSAFGSAPLPPPAKDDRTAVGRTNDAILYAGRVVLWCRCEDAQIAELGPKVPSSASRDYGVPFAETFKRYNGDFYKIDPHLFSPAEVVLHNLTTGRSFQFGKSNPAVAAASFYG